MSDRGYQEVAVQDFAFVEASSRDGVPRFYVRLMQEDKVYEISVHASFAEAKTAADRLNGKMVPPSTG